MRAQSGWVRLMRGRDNVHMTKLLFTASQQAGAQAEANNPKVKQQVTLCHLSLHSLSLINSPEAEKPNKSQGYALLFI